jgi:hypothetical protein
VQHVVNTLEHLGAAEEGVEEELDEDGPQLGAF